MDLVGLVHSIVDPEDFHSLDDGRLVAMVGLLSIEGHVVVAISVRYSVLDL